MSAVSGFGLFIDLESSNLFNIVPDPFAVAVVSVPAARCL